MVDTADHETLATAIGNDLNELEGWGAHVVAVVTDNGSNMIAVSALLTQRCPGLIPIRCAVHSLQLAVKHMLVLAPLQSASNVVHRVVHAFREYEKRHTLKTVQLSLNAE